MAAPIRVLVVDDSAFMRKMLCNILESDPALQVIDTAQDGHEAVAKVVALRPDVVTLDVEMPHLDGLGALSQIIARAPCPVVMVSSVTQKGASAAIRALTLGAVDVIAKPSGSVSLDLPVIAPELISKVKTAAAIASARLRQVVNAVPVGAVTQKKEAAAPGRRQLTHLLVMASSTGGPSALHRFFSHLQPNLPIAICLIQHMPAGLTQSLAEHLSRNSLHAIREAGSGDRLLDGMILLAPGGKHLHIEAGGTIRLSDEATRHGVRPAADVTLESVPDSLIRKTLVIVMTGMGMDGSSGAARLKAKGAEVWAQSEASSVVFGMARAVVEQGVTSRVGTPENLAEWLPLYLHV